MTGPESPSEPSGDSQPPSGPSFSGRFGTPPVSKEETKRRRQLMTIFLATVVLLILFGLLRGPTGGGGISATKFGSLEIGKATVSNAHAIFGLESDLWNATHRSGAPVAFRGELWRYGCPGLVGSVFGTPCRTLLGFVNGRLQSVLTNNSRFSTHAGTRIGVTVAQAVKRDHGKWSGFGVKCPAVVFPSQKGVVFGALVFRNAANPGGVVSGFYLSTVPGSFRACSRALPT